MSSDHPAGIHIDMAHRPDELWAVAELFAEVWKTEPGHWVFSPELLRSLAHAGGAVHVAYAGDALVGASAAVFYPPAEKAVYSLIAAAHPSDQGVGFALKQAQRAWALEHGVNVMRWTFDPLVGRNARFNLVKLGAVAREYTVDFYGVINDGVQGDDETDRLTIEWQLDKEGPSGHVPEPSDPTGVAPDGGPLTGRDQDTLWCRVPQDIVAVRRDDPAQASAWRVAVREVLAPAMAEGFVATGMTRTGWYRLERK